MGKRGALKLRFWLLVMDLLAWVDRKIHKLRRAVYGTYLFAVASASAADPSWDGWRPESDDGEDVQW